MNSPDISRKNFIFYLRGKQIKPTDIISLCS